MRSEEQIIDKVRKLLALTESSNEHEAALAAERAQELMLRYGVELAKVAAAEERTGIGVDTVTRSGVKVDPWRTTLAGAVADAMGGRVVYWNEYRKWSGTMEFWGQRGTVAGMVALYEYLEAQCLTVSTLEVGKEWVRGTLANAAQSMRWRRSFIMGMVERVAKRLRLRYQAIEREADNSKALVLVRDVVADALQAKYPRMERARRVQVDACAYAAGLEAGANVDLGDRRLGNRRAELGA